MAKYRLLSDKELAELEEDFVKYLVVNGIDADQWKDMLVNQTEKAQKITDLFSDVVFEKIMREISFLDFYASDYIQAIQCLEDKMIMVAIKRKSGDLDLSEIDLGKIPADQVEIFQGEKSYQKSREEELFEMTEKGYQISEGQLFKQLILKTV